MSGPAGQWVLGVDSGGSGLRASLAEGTERRLGPVRSTVPVRTGADGIDAGHLLELLAPLASDLMARAGTERLAAVAVGAAGMASLGDRLRAELPGALRDTYGAGRLALAADAVTAYAGALGPRPGAVVAAGTGLIALGTDLRSWRRADGWGHLLGDCGSGAWIGRAGLEAALRAYDGRSGGSTALLERAEQRFGPAGALPAQLYPRTDRPAVLASFAPEVAACAPSDPVAEAILRAAAEHIADCAAAVTPTTGEPELALTGGLLNLGEPLLAPLGEQLARRVPQARAVPAGGDPLDGAVRLALGLASGDPGLPADARMLWLAADD
ncbi:ATPase [Streptomyces sp. NA04227]|uniref:N-acetylglucosamine kinase n=1 Tax=Streptomyces sp. NA04227 TaxID=2742136 RepID=UPI0015916DF6|nr:BadF/BadG/BcrA/BcrD ATPase family protein [Streptomyces sp. NA04227]QKW05274.1 ATPase [Streptomyces sp. NA04227]